MHGKVERAQVLEILNQETILKSNINLGIWSFSPVYEFVIVLSIIFSKVWELLLSRNSVLRRLALLVSIDWESFNILDLTILRVW